MAEVHKKLGKLQSYHRIPHGRNLKNQNVLSIKFFQKVLSLYSEGFFSFRELWFYEDNIQLLLNWLFSKRNSTAAVSAVIVGNQV